MPSNRASRHPGRVKRRWRDYRTAAGRRPVKNFTDALSDEDAAQIAAAMRDVREKGTNVARHLDGDIYEIRANGVDNSYRLLFSEEGTKSQILLSLLALEKHSQKTPAPDLRVAKQRLADWRSRARSARQQRTTRPPKRPPPAP